MSTNILPQIKIYHPFANEELFIKKALNGLQEAQKSGVEVIGYLHWSFCDNFEWQKGFSMQFGLVEVDRDNNFKRTKKPSLDLLGSYTKIFNK